ncbi:glutathione S-transferase family protein [Lentisalinibacter salinarum]|uniref:glutathione S-transferase family protein n=1 Tax=Lentisalinibacter salinarum TaxID=2992239 RepID=UPI00386BDE83
MSYPELHLVSHKLCPYVQRARIVLAEKHIPHAIEFIDLSRKPDWFLKISPLGKVPVLCVDGRPMFESAVIAEYLDEISPGSLHPTDSFAKAENRSWIEFASAVLNSIAVFYRATDERALSAAAVTLRERFERLERALRGGPWFNGESFSLVDAAFGPVFRYFEVIEEYGDFGFFEGLSRVEAWRYSLAARPSVSNAVVDDYRERLRAFFLGLDSQLGRLTEAAEFGEERKGGNGAGAD